MFMHFVFFIYVISSQIQLTYYEDDWEVRRLYPENDNVTIYTLKPFMLLKVRMFCPRCINIK